MEAYKPQSVYVTGMQIQRTKSSFTLGLYRKGDLGRPKDQGSECLCEGL